MMKSYRVRLEPNNKQNTRLFQYAGCARFACNWALTREQENYEHGGKFLSDYDLRKEFTQIKRQPGYEWLNNVSNNVTKQAIKDACEAFRRFFRGTARHPRFKSKKRSKPSFYQDTVKIQFTETHVKVEGLSGSRRKNRQKLNWIRLCEKGRIPVGVKYCNPRFTFDGLYWYVSVSVECEDSAFIPTTDGIGIDLGVKNLATCSDGKVYKNINKTKRVRKLEKRRRRLQRRVSRQFEKNKKGGSYCKTRNIIKSKRKLLKVMKRLTNIRHNHLHQTTSEIVSRKPMFICIEDLNVSGMMKNQHLSKAIQQQEFYEFRRQLEYKCGWTGIRLIIADRFFPSSRLCICCGAIKKDLKLSNRIFRCDCGNVIDRDLQAALNLKRYGESHLSQSIA